MAVAQHQHQVMTAAAVPRAVHMLACVGVFLVTGCAPSVQELEMRRLAKQVESMQLQLSSADKKVEELSSRVFVLSGQLTVVQEKVSERHANLNVVRLDADERPERFGSQHTTAHQGDISRANRGEHARQLAAEQAGELQAGYQWTDEPAIDITMSGPPGAEILSIAQLPPVPEFVRMAAPARPQTKKAARPRSNAFETAQAKKIQGDKLLGDKLFNEALAAYGDGRFGVALSLFERMVSDYSSHERADNALFWLGECRFELHDFLGAATTFADVLARYPSSNKTPDALMKTGLAYERLGDGSNAQRAFAELVRRFPKTPLAELARHRLPGDGDTQ